MMTSTKMQTICYQNLNTAFIESDLGAYLVAVERLNDDDG